MVRKEEFSLINQSDLDSGWKKIGPCFITAVWHNILSHWPFKHCNFNENTDYISLHVHLLVYDIMMSLQYIVILKVLEE